MKAKRFLPDSSAILAMMDNEDGADEVQEILGKEKILLPAVVLYEVYYITIQNSGMEAAEWRYATLKSIKATHLTELTEPVLLRGGEFKACYPISFADSVIAAYAFFHDAILIHKDPEYEVLTMVEQLKLPYKSKKEKKSS